MDRYLPFLARCPTCGYHWLQDGYTRRGLRHLLDSKSIIEAYCMRCAVLWPISAAELQALSEELTREAGPRCAHRAPQASLPDS
jgi:hypothetical protein